MSNFIRTNDLLHVKDKNITIKFIKTSSFLEKKHNNIILFNNTLPYYHLNNIDNISYDVAFLYEHKITPHILYCNRNYIKIHHKLIHSYLLEYGDKINEIYLSKDILNYDFNYTHNNIQYFEDIKHFDNIIANNNGEIDVGLLGIILSLYLNYTRICYTFDIDITLDSISKLKEVKDTYQLENKISVYNCSDIDNRYLKKQPIHHILKPIILIQQFFIHRIEERQHELIECLKKNINNPYIDKIILLNEQIYDLNKYGINSDKIEQVNIKYRLSYHYALNYIKTSIDNSHCILANTDIYFDESIQTLRSLNLTNKFLALLRYNINEDNSVELHNGGRPDSQDAWIIDSDINIDIDDDFKFNLGKPGCDNAITYIMFKNRYVVYNPSLTIKSYHLHKTDIRDYNSTELVITPFYLFSEPTEIKPLIERYNIIKNIEPYIIHKDDLEENFVRKNPHSYYDIDTLLNNRNNNASDKISWNNKNNFIRHQEPYIAKLSEVKVGTDGIIYNRTSKFIINPIYDKIDVNTSNKIFHFDELATVVQRWGYGFYHFISEQLPKILYLQKFLLSSNENIKILTYYNNTYIKEILELCGINKNNIIEFSNNYNYSAKNLYVSKPIYCGNPSKEDIELIRNTLHINDNVNLEDNETPIGIIIKRDMNSVRSIINFDNIVMLIKEKFPEKKWVIFEHLSIKDSITLFKKADIIVAPHGAGLSNMIFSAKGIHILEYVIENEPNLCYWHLSELLGNNYHCIPVKYSGMDKKIEVPYDRTIETLYKITHNKLPTIHKPLRRNDNYDHVGDTFRELINLWEENGLVKVIPSENVHPWLNGIENILLYDRPTYKWFIPSDLEYNLCLFGNPNPLQDVNNNSAWIFWARRPKLLNIYSKKILSYEDRDITSAFFGKIENKKQERYRTSSDWSKSVELFDMPINGKYKYSQEEYLQVMRRVKFGLCLRGFGVKCNREIELFGLGVVPIFTPGVSRMYYRRLKKNVHYLYAETPEDVPEVIKNCSKKQWEELSKAGKKWYEENCSILGSFKTTMTIVQERLPGALDNCIIKDKLDPQNIVKKTEDNKKPKTINIHLFGTDYGGFYLPTNISEYLNKDSAIYLFGVGEDITFDTYLSGLLDCKVHMFDPTPRSIEHIKEVKKVIDKTKEPIFNKRYGGGDVNYWDKIISYNAKSENLLMYDYGLCTEDGNLKFYKPDNDEYVSHSLLEGMCSKDFITVQVKKIRTIMNELGHNHIDLIKLDVEGVECAVIHQMFDEGIYPTFICIEFDIARNKKIDGVKIANKCLNRITTSGYQLIKRDNLDMSFIKIN